MCIGVFLWKAHPLYPFLLLLNRDEYYSRGTKRVGWWWGQGEGEVEEVEVEVEVLGGKDEVGGGTWLGCTRLGKIAFLTNVRQRPSDQLPNPKSRGHLPLAFLQSKMSPMEFAGELAKEASKYNGFNLVMVDVCSTSMVHVTNSGGSCLVSQVPPGLHVLSNASLDTPWPKAQRLRDAFREYMDRCGEAQVLPAKHMAETLMTNRIRDDDIALLPGILSPHWESAASSIFVTHDTPLGRYGTRSSSVLSVDESGRVVFYERHLPDNDDRQEWEEHTETYQINQAVGLSN